MMFSHNNAGYHNTGFLGIGAMMAATLREIFPIAGPESSMSALIGGGEPVRAL